MLCSKQVVLITASPFTYRVLLVKKKDNTGRSCVDYRSFNYVITKDQFPILTMNLLMIIWSTLVLNWISGYDKIRMCEHDIPKTAFKTDEGHYEFLVMSYLLKQSVIYFSSCNEWIFKPYYKICHCIFWWYISIQWHYLNNLFILPRCFNI